MKKRREEDFPDPDEENSIQILFITPDGQRI